jgi:undecaprenyl diphosphate synthase
MAKSSEGPLDPRAVLGLEPEQLPGHIAIIMDGNGRWAGQRNLPRVRGHEEGAKTVRTVATQCARLGINALTLFSFSAENWRRPKEEIDFLMRLCVQYLVTERNEIVENNIRLLHVGRREGLPEDVLRELDATMEQSRRNTGLQMALALNYGSRTEILDAVKRIARRVGDGDLRVEDIDETLFSRSLYTSGLPDPDLLIRTASQYRISNFLLWQISYAELYVTDVLWPDFGASHLHAAIQEYARRERRFGAVGKQT